MKVLSLSTCYPNLAEPNLGIFVHRRLEQMAEQVQIRVVAPVPLVDYAGIKVGKGWSATKDIPNQREQGKLTIYHPRWWYPPGGGFLNPFLLAQQVRGICREIQSDFDFDLIDAHFAYPNGIAAALLSKSVGRPFSITLRGNEPMHAETSTGVRWWTDWALRRASTVFAVSGRLAEWAVSRGAAQLNVHTVPNGVDSKVFHYAEPDPNLRAEIGLDSSAPIILSVGYLIERKGHHQIIRAAHRLREERTSAHVVIVGESGREGRFEDRLKGLVKELEMDHQVHFLGRQPQERIAKWMNAASVLVLASTREGWPNVVQESLASGCPVIATDIGGTPDMIPDRRYGHIVTDNSAQTLASALREALAQPWDRKAIADWGGRRSWGSVALDVVSRMQSNIAKVNR